MRAEEQKREKYLPTLLVQQIRLQWYKDCRGGNAAAQRNQYPRAVRYRYDWHIGAMPERYTYDKTGQKQPLNELALDLAPGEYGRAVCNGRFRDWDTGIWYYVLDILNVMPLTELTDSLTSFTDREPNKIYTQIDRLW